MRNDQAGRGQPSTNTQIITTDGSRREGPRNLLSAISEIQQFYVIESKGQDIPGEFLTLERTLDFFKIGVKSGFHEGFTLALLFPIFHFYLFPFVFRQSDFFTQLLFASIPYLVLVINTGMCCYISRYYVGNITRKAINALFSGRALALLGKAFLIYVVYLLVFRLSTPENVWRLVHGTGSTALKLYYGYFEIKPHLLPVATKSVLLMATAAIIPYGSVFLLDSWSKYRIRKNAKTISA